jgi:hypothetical protein
MSFDVSKKEDIEKWLHPEEANMPLDEWFKAQDVMADAWATHATTPCTWTEDVSHMWRAECRPALKNHLSRGGYCTFCSRPIQERPHKPAEAVAFDSSNAVCIDCGCSDACALDETCRMPDCPRRKT